MRRTNTCGELTKHSLKKSVVLNGWVHTRRDHGGVIFIDLRDRYGLTQVVINPDNKHFKTAEKIRREDVLEVSGTIRERPKGMKNPNMVTGEIEVIVKDLEILNKAETPPIEVDDRIEASEDMRLKYRYLDLRRPVMQNRLIIRHKAAQAAREYLNSQDFLEIETPLLIRATPEGARDYVVPSRLHQGQFFSLPQSPQLYKQILMVSGMDKYYQLARCLRDEDLRADRQPEFTQIDIEQSFVDVDDIIETCEGMIKHIWKKAIGTNVKIPFPRLTYKEAMDKYGIDKPDIRFELELIDVTDLAKKSDFNVFKNAELVKCINPEGDFSRKDLDELEQLAESYGAKGLAWMKVTDKGLESSIVKFFSPALQKELLKKTKTKKGSVLLFVADKWAVCNDVMARLRLDLGKKLKLINEKEFSFVWIVDFPLFEWGEENGRWAPMHHIFSMPKDECVKYLEKDPSKVLGKLYDLALNGAELGGGSIRIHKKDLQERVLKVIGLDYSEAEKRFGFLLNAFKYGAPPHGGIAFGLDRIASLLCGFNDIREVMAFPKNKAAECLMDSCPSQIDEHQLKELRINIAAIKKKSLVLEEVKIALDKEKKEYKLLEHEPVFTAEEAAKARGTKLKQSAKTLVLKADDEFVMAVVPGDKEIDLVKLKEKLEVKKLDLASAEDVKEVTGCSIGSVPPFGNLFNLKVYVDKEFTKNKEIAFNAGSPTTSMKMSCEAYLDVVRPEVLEFSK